MPYFAVHYRYADDAAALDAVRPRHREYLRELVGAQSLVASGPYVGTTPAQALLLFRGDSAADVEALLAADPIQQAGLVVEWSLAEWNPVIGVFAPPA